MYLIVVPTIDPAITKVCITIDNMLLFESDGDKPSLDEVNDPNILIFQWELHMQCGSVDTDELADTNNCPDCAPNVLDKIQDQFATDSFVIHLSDSDKCRKSCKYE